MFRFFFYVLCSYGDATWQRKKTEGERVWRTSFQCGTQWEQGGKKAMCHISLKSFIRMRSTHTQSPEHSVLPLAAARHALLRQEGKILEINPDEWLPYHSQCAKICHSVSNWHISLSSSLVTSLSKHFILYADEVRFELEDSHSWADSHKAWRDCLKAQWKWVLDPQLI